MRRFLPPLVAVAVLALPASASANAFQDLFREYQRTGAINGCKHSSKELTQAKRQVPNDIEQYAPDFPAALDAAAAQRATGACKKASKKQAAAPVATPAPGTPSSGTPAQPTATTGAPTGAAPAAPGTTPQPVGADQPAPAAADAAIATQAASTDSGADDTPAPLVLLAIIGALLLAAAAVWGSARWWAWEPAWLARFKHAGSEAGWRSSASWAEFRDWLRFGR